MSRPDSPGPMTGISIENVKPATKPSKCGAVAISCLAVISIVSLALGAAAVAQVSKLNDKIAVLEAADVAAILARDSAHTHAATSTEVASLDGRLAVLEAGILVSGSIAAPSGYALRGSLTAGTGEWAPEVRMPSERSDLQAVFCGGSIVLLGGLNSTGDVVGDVTKYDPVLEAYTHGASPMPTPRYRFGAACLDGKIYVAGGYATATAGDAGHCLATVDAYDVASDSWTSAPPMPTRRGDLALASLGGKLYAMGGYGYEWPYPDTARAKNEEFDPAAGTWRELAALPNDGRGDISAAVLGDKIYIPGGWNEVFLDSLISYAPATDSWSTSLAKMSSPRGDKSIAVVAHDGESHLYVIGGETWSGKKGPCSWDAGQQCDINKVPMHSCEKYYPDEDAWIPISPVPEARFRAAAAADASGAIHTFGGQAHGEVAVNTAWSFRYVHQPEVFFHAKA